MNIILFGSPGSGKGTQAMMLENYLHLKRISLGDILREEIGKDSELGREVKSYMEKGVLVPDELISRVISESIDTQGFILDGYPRNLNQVNELEEIMRKSNMEIDVFIYLNIGQQTIIDRLSKRRVCKNCGANYHLENVSPKKEGICDSCGSELIQRKDDTPEVIKKRWKVFFDESQKILDFYQNKNRLIKIDGDGDREKIFGKIKEKLQ